MFIADIGINHNGDLEIAKNLIKIAEECGVDVVKFQKRNPDICVPEAEKDIVKDTVFGRMKYIDYKYRMEFGKCEYDEIARYCRERGIAWTASVWDNDSLDFICNYDVPFIKVPSACITDTLLLTRLSHLDKKVIISTGMSTEDEISRAVNILDKGRLGILHCNSSYPSEPGELDLNYIATLKTRYPQHRIGYSGHEEGFIPTIIAKAIGAEIIERHITLDKNMKGSDQKASLDPVELKELVRYLKLVPEILGQNKKTVYRSELEVMKKLRRRG